MSLAVYRNRGPKQSPSFRGLQVLMINTAMHQGSRHPVPSDPVAWKSSGRAGEGCGRPAGCPGCPPRAEGSPGGTYGTAAARHVVCQRCSQLWFALRDRGAVRDGSAGSESPKRPTTGHPAQPGRMLPVDEWTCRHFSLANPTGPTATDLPLLLRRAAEEIERREINPMQILDLTVSSEISEDGPEWSVTLYWSPDREPG